MGDVTVDFVVEGDSPSGWKMILVEQGPWIGADIEENLRRIQDRLYGCLEAALDGQLADRFPASRGKSIVIVLEGFNLPEEPVRTFFECFASNVLTTPDYRDAAAENQNVSRVSFEIKLRTLPAGA